MEIRDEIDREIYEVGKPLIDSEFFEATKNQAHHKKTTLYKHIMGVARWSVKICDRIEEHGRHDIDRRSVIIAALCHDIGMIGRDAKFANNFQACRQHPKDSAALMKEYFPDVDEATVKMVEKHMWPLHLTPPTSFEEWIVIQADKLASGDDISLKKSDKDN